MREYTRGPKYQIQDISWHVKSFLVQLSFNFFHVFLKITFALFIAVNEVNSKHSQVSRSLINL